MKYVSFIVMDPDAEPYVAEEDNFAQWDAEQKRDGKLTLKQRLTEPSDGRTVRVRNGEVLITDGPFTESKEWIAGFAMLECDSIDEATELVSRHAMARFGRIEIRPVWPGAA
jgi:hypothetical protein